MDNAAARERGLKSGERRRNLVDTPRDLDLRRHVDVVFGKVDARFKQRDQFYKGLLGGRSASAERAAHLTGGLPRLRESLRIDEVANRFGLRQIETARQKSALGKFAGLSQPRAQLHCPPKQELQHHRRTVRRNLHQIFRRVRIRRGEESHESFVNARPIRVRRVEHVGQARAGVFKGLMRANELERDDADCGPLRRTIPMPPRPGGVEIAAIVSVTACQVRPWAAPSVLFRALRCIAAMRIEWPGSIRHASCAE